VGGLHPKTTNSEPSPSLKAKGLGGGTIWFDDHRFEHAMLNRSDIRVL
jgi:hypothetical protein